MKYLKKDYKSFKPYHFEYIEEGIILNANESPFKLPKKIINDFTKKVKSFPLNRYPDTDTKILKNVLANKYHLLPENVTCGVGSDSLINYLYQAVLSIGDNILTVEPTFSMYYKYAALYQANVIKVSLDNNFQFDIKKFIEVLKKQTIKIIVLCSPNNPTGNVISIEDIKTILSFDLLTIVDEAYGEFIQTTSIPLINEYANLIILKTFSKAFGFAGGRIGFALSSRENIEMIETVKSPYFVNSLSMLLATAIIENSNLFEKQIDYILREKNKLYKKLKSLNIEIYPSEANFLFVRLDEKIIAEIKKNKIYLRHLQYNGQDYYRITIGLKNENIKLLEVIKQCVTPMS